MSGICKIEEAKKEEALEAPNMDAFAEDTLFSIFEFEIDSLMATEEGKMAMRNARRWEKRRQNTKKGPISCPSS